MDLINGRVAFDTVLLLATVVAANKRLKREISKRENRSRLNLCSVIGSTIACFKFTEIGFKGPVIYPGSTNTTFLKVLLTVFVIDVRIILLTIILKVTVTLFPDRMLSFDDRVSLFVKKVFFFFFYLKHYLKILIMIFQHFYSRESFIY